MAILIETTGPISGLPDVLAPSDRTFADMINELSDEVDDTTNEYNAQIQKAIFNAVRVCEREPFYFNETLKQSFVTKKGQTTYGFDDNPKIATAAGISALYFKENGGAAYLLDKVYPERIELLSNSNSSGGKPIIYSYFDQAISLYPTPDAEYTIIMQLSPVRFDRISRPDEVSPWFVEAYDLIRARAKYELYKNYIKDLSLAQVAYNDWVEQRDDLKAETSRRLGTGIIRGTRW